MIFFLPLAIFCTLLSLVSAAPSPTPQGSVDSIQRRQLSRAKLVQLAARDPARRADPSSVPNGSTPVRPFKIRFEGEQLTSFRGTYASNPNPPEGPTDNFSVVPGRSLADAGVYTLNSNGQLVSVVTGRIGYASAVMDGYVMFLPSGSPLPRYPAPLSCQVGSDNVLSCVKSLDPLPGSSAYVCNQVLAYGVCQQAPGAGGPRATTVAVFV